MARVRPPEFLPRDVIARPDFADACDRRDLGEIFRLAVKWGGAGLTVSHLARRCEMSVGRVNDYIKDRKLPRASRYSSASVRACASRARS
jgi:hypothetical protein